VTEGHPDAKQLWKNRRWQAWLSFCALIGLGCVLIWGPELKTVNGEVLGVIAWTLALIVLAYHGGNIAEKFADKK